MAFTYLKVKSAKCLCLLPVVMVLVLVLRIWSRLRHWFGFFPISKLQHDRRRAVPQRGCLAECRNALLSSGSQVPSSGRHCLTQMSRLLDLLSVPGVMQQFGISLMNGFVDVSGGGERCTNHCW